MTKMIGELYQWLWFRTEFWLTPLDRRPYTFIMRDWIHAHWTLTGVMIALWYAGLVALAALDKGVMSLVLGSLSSFLLAHLIWGSRWIENQQEVPAYLGQAEGDNYDRGCLA